MGAFDDAKLISEIEQVLEAAGMSVLEFSISINRGGVRARAVIYVPSGTGTAECAAASRLILPRLQMALGAQDPEIEVSSPGIDRAFKSTRDWKAFVGKRIRYLPKGESEWISGTLVEFDGSRVGILGPRGRTDIEISAIAKARLDASHEGE